MNLFDFISWDVIKGFVRHGLTTGGGWLIAQGALMESDLEAVIGAGLVIVGAIFSAVKNKNISQ